MRLVATREHGVCKSARTRQSNDNDKQDHAMASFNFRQFRTLAAAAVLGVSAVTGAMGQTTALTSSNSKGNTNYLNNFNGGTSSAYTWWTGANYVNDGNSSFWVYCIDPKTNASWGTAGYTVGTLSSFLYNDLPPSNLTGYEQQFNSGGGSGDSSGYVGLGYKLQTPSLVDQKLRELYSHAYADSLTSAVKAAAFGYAVWEIMGDASSTGTYDRMTPGQGALQSWGSSTSSSSDSLDVQIDAYLNALNNNSWGNVNNTNLSAITDYVYTVYFDTDPHKMQNFLRVTERTEQVPEPVSLALVGVALAGAWGGRRRAKSLR